jgi:hypothetical protein
MGLPGSGAAGVWWAYAEGMVGKNSLPSAVTRTAAPLLGVAVLLSGAVLNYWKTEIEHGGKCRQEPLTITGSPAVTSRWQAGQEPS